MKPMIPTHEWALKVIIGKLNQVGWTVPTGIPDDEKWGHVIARLVNVLDHYSDLRDLADGL